MWLRGIAFELLRKSVASAAQDAVREALANRAANGSADSQAEKLPDIALFFAYNSECGALYDLLEDVQTTKFARFREHVGTLDGTRLALIETGPGISVAKQAALDYLQAEKPKYVVCAGFATALQSDLRRGQIIMADRVLHANDEPFDLGFRLSPEETERTGVRVGTVLSSESAYLTPQEKLRLGQETSALVLDQESYGVASACAENRVRLLCVRIVIESAEMSVPPDIAKTLQKKDWTEKLGAFTGLVTGRLSSAKDLWNLAEDTLKASRKLANFLRIAVAPLCRNGA